MAVFNNNNDNRSVCTNLLKFFLRRAPSVFTVEYLSPGETSIEEVKNICAMNASCIGGGYLFGRHTLLLQNKVEVGTVLNNKAKDASAYREIRLLESEYTLDKLKVEYQRYLDELVRKCLLGLGFEEDSHSVYKVGVITIEPDGGIHTPLMTADVIVGQDEIVGHHVVLHYRIRRQLTENGVTKDYDVCNITPVMLRTWRNEFLHKFASRPGLMKFWRFRFGIRFAGQFSKTIIVSTIKRPCIEFRRSRARAGRSSRVVRAESLNGLWGMKQLCKHFMKRSPSLTRWKLLFPQDEQFSLTPAYCFATLVQDEAKKIGMRIRFPDIMRYKRNEDVCGFVRRALMDGREEKRPQLIMAVLPEKNDSLFARFKQTCKANNVASQCFYADELQNDVATLVELISKLSYTCVSINVKNKGYPWLVKVDRRISKGGIVFGICVRREENGSFLLSYVAISLRERRGPLPKAIFLYGHDFGAMINDAFENKIREMYTSMDAQPPTVVSVLVLNRTALQVFRERENDDHGWRVGTVIEIPGLENEFYLLSEPCHSQIIQPSRYIILLNTGNLSKTSIKKNTLALCHLYYDDGQLDGFQSTSCPYHLKVAMRNMREYIRRE